MAETNVGKLMEEIRSTIDHFVREFDVTNLEIIGALEVIKHTVFVVMEEEGK